MSIAHSIFLVLKGFLCFVDPTSSREIEREEPSLTIVTQTRTVKPEEKVEKMPMKRQRRQKTTSDSISKEEEKKVRDDKVLKQSTLTMRMNLKNKIKLKGLGVKWISLFRK